MPERIVQLFLLAVIAWAATYARFVLAPLQETLRAHLFLSDNQTAWLQGPAIAVPMAIGAIPLGILIDRHSRARLLLVLAIVAVSGTLLTAYSPSLAILFAGRCMVGISLAGTLVAAYSMVGDLYQPAQRGRASMVVAMGEIGGAPAAFALGGALLAANGPISVSGGWREAVLWMALPLAPVVLLTLALIEPPRTGVTRRNPPLREVWPLLRRYRGVILALLLARVMVWIADGAVLIWAAPTFTRRFSLPPEYVGAIMGTTLLVSGMLGPLVGGPLADFCQRAGGPRRTVLVLGVLALLSAPAALFPLAHTAVFGSFLLGWLLATGYIVGTAGITLATIVIPGELRGLFLAFTITGAALFFIGVAPLAVSGLSALLGGPNSIGEALAIVTTATSLSGAVVLTFGSRYFPRAMP